MTLSTLSLSRQKTTRRLRPVLTALVAVIGTGIVATGYAMGQAETMDADGDGLVTLSELQTAMPDMTEAEFAALDANADGALDAGELAAAQEAGLIATG